MLFLWGDHRENYSYSGVVLHVLSGLVGAVVYVGSFCTFYGASFFTGDGFISHLFLAVCTCGWYELVARRNWLGVPVNCLYCVEIFKLHVVGWFLLFCVGITYCVFLAAQRERVDIHCLLFVVGRCSADSFMS